MAEWGWGWIIVSLLIPILAPFFGLVFLKIFPFPVVFPKAITLVKDGQLGWAALGFSSSAMYELFVPGAGMMPSTGTEYILTIVGAGFLSATSGVMAALGSVLPTPHPRPAGSSRWRHYSVLLNSIVLTVVAGLLYASVHYGKVGVQLVG